MRNGMGCQVRKPTTAVTVSGVGLSRFVIMGGIITLSDKCSVLYFFVS